MTVAVVTETSAERFSPVISRPERTIASCSSAPSAASGPEKTPARIAPASRRRRVTARVSMPLMPTMPFSTSSSSRLRRRAEVADDPAGVAHDVAGDPDAPGLRVLVVHARVADVRCRHDDDLARVARVGQGLLVAGHAGREDGLAEGAAAGAVGAALVAGAVLEHEDCRVGVERHGVVAFGGGSWRTSRRRGAASSVGAGRRSGGRCRRAVSPSVPAHEDEAVALDPAVDGPGGEADAAKPRRRR